MNLITKLNASDFKFFLLILAIGVFSTGYAQPKAKAKTGKITTVIIDAGHGGKDGGCKGISHFEKNITLAVALKLGKMIYAEFPKVQVYYTRADDTFIPLDDRASIANSNNADLFISIHCNAVPSNKNAIQGTETYTMGMHVKESNLQVAKRENESILFEDGYLEKYDGYNPNSDQAYILLNLFQNAYISQSVSFASRVEGCLKKCGRQARGVHQAGFLVLRKTAMPSVLIEIGYLTNPTEEKFLSSEKGQNAIAKSILEAFRYYKADVEKTKVVIPKEVAEEDSVAEEEASEAEAAEAVPAATEATVTKESPLVGDKPEPPAEAKTVVTEKATKAKKNKVEYAVQIAASPTELDLNAAKFKKAGKVQQVKFKERYIYIVDRSADFSVVQKAVGNIRKNGFPDAFLIPLINNVRASMDEVNALKEE